MPLKPLIGLTLPRRGRAKTRIQNMAKSQATIRAERLKNLEKARKKRKKNLRVLKKKATA